MFPPVEYTSVPQTNYQSFDHLMPSLKAQSIYKKYKKKKVNCVVDGPHDFHARVCTRSNTTSSMHKAFFPYIYYIYLYYLAIDYTLYQNNNLMYAQKVPSTILRTISSTAQHQSMHYIIN